MPKCAGAGNIPFDGAATRNAWVVYQLKLRGSSLAELSRRHNLSRTVISQALITPYPKAEKILASELGISQEELFPERYVAGNRIDRRRSTNA